MLQLAMLLSLCVGVTLGLLGGGGSILMLPILVYVVGMDPMASVTVSLGVVGATSLTSLVPHARAGRVRWNTGLFFGAAGMAGAIAGGHIGPHLPPKLVLGVFGGVMLFTAVLMLRGRRLDGASSPKRLDVPRSLIQGFSVGLVAGLAGAGGGFLVVPTLVLLGGLSMAEAVGTSLLVITLQSLAGFVTHLGATAIDWRLAGVITASAVVGGAVGAQFANRVPQVRLRRAFAWLVLALGVFMLVKQLPRSGLDFVLQPALRPLLGGALIGLSAALLWWLHGRIAGVSGIAGGFLSARGEERAWRGWFLAGLLVGGAVMARVVPQSFGASPARLGLLVASGVFVGVGTTLAGGCTSGHGICGVGGLSRRSWIATLAFIFAGVVVVFVTHHLLAVGGVTS